MTSYFYEESKLNVPQGISLTLFVFVCSIVLTDASSSATQTDFDFNYTIEELSCDPQPEPIKYHFEFILSLLSVISFFILAVYLAITERKLSLKFKSKSVTFLLFLTCPRWIYTWGGLWKAYLAIHSLLLYRYLICYLVLPSQSDKNDRRADYAKKMKNASKAKSRKALALLAKQKRDKDSKKKKQEILTSQASKQDFSNLSLDLSDYALDMLGPIWFKFRELMEKFNFDLSSFSFSTITTFIGDNWEGIRNCELFEEFNHVLRLAITLGWIKKIEATVKGIPIFVS